MQVTGPVDGGLEEGNDHFGFSWDGAWQLTCHYPEPRWLVYQRDPASSVQSNAPTPFLATAIAAGHGCGSREYYVGIGPEMIIDANHGHDRLRVHHSGVGRFLELALKAEFHLSQGGVLDLLPTTE
jgi:hypothetical protein